MNGQERLNSPPKLGGVPARPSSSKKGRAGGVVPKPLLTRVSYETTPSAPASVASQHFFDGAATPPNLGGESSRSSIHSHLHRTEQMNPQVIALAGPSKGKVFGLTPGDFSIGRDASNSLSLNDALISRQHALIRITDSEVTILDLNSTN